MTMRQCLRVGVVLGVLGAGLVAPAAAATILVFGQTGGANAFTGNETGGLTVLDATNIPVTITTLNELAVNQAAFFNLDATSTGPAVNVGGAAWTQPYSGSFTITSGANGAGFNYLSGLFTGTELGLVGGHTYVLGSSQPPLTLTLTSSIPGLPLTTPAMALALTNVLPAVAIANGSFADFSANLAGTFSAEAEPRNVPEPASLLLCGTALAVSVRRLRSRRRALSH